MLIVLRVQTYNTIDYNVTIRLYKLERILMQQELKSALDFKYFL